ncbi:MAG: hypothetical protein ABI239_03430 [Aquihabitans sp.]
MIDPDRLSDLRIAKLRTLASLNWTVPAGATATSFPAGATLFDPATARLWVLVDENADRRLGGVLAVARRAEATEIQVISDDVDGAGVMARRAEQFRDDVHVWTLVDGALQPVPPAPTAQDRAPAPEAEVCRSILVDGGLEVVVEGGNLTGEILGLEVARVVVDDAGAHVEAGVGRFDREAGDLIRGDMPAAASVERVAELVRPMRRPGAERHPLNQMVPERWLRAILIARPELVGAASLRPVGSARPRKNLLEDGVATAVGTGLDGAPVVMVCSTGVYLDAVPSAADDHQTHGPDARLVMVVPERDDVPVTQALVERMRHPAEVVTVPDDWRNLTAESD